ncbi:MAG: LytTR family DNA-binding domain-containing protein [Pseudomonadota bacterium]|nr:LytTR family DNA-binding domain-containing protein [Pseudomonadota bacterium]
MNPPAPSAIIAEDEEHLGEYLRVRLKVLWPELVVAGVAHNGVEAEAMLRSEAPDIAFLDIRMPGLTGIEVARRADQALHIVFVTAYDEYAVEAFRHAAVDYLLKPVMDDRLQETIVRLKERIASRVPAEVHSALAVLSRLAQHDVTSRSPERLVWIRASVGDQVRLINTDDVSYFQSNDKYTCVFTADAEALIRTPLRELGEQLDPERFWQVHRGTIVNVAHIETTTRDLSGRLSITLKQRPERITVSRAYASRFKTM